MASTTSDFTSNSSHSPRSSGFPGDGLNSPQFGRNGRSSLSSPWANIVRGESSESSAVAAPSSPHCFSLPKNSVSQVSEKIIPEVSISDCSLPVILKASLSSNTDNNNSYSGMTTEAAQQQQQPPESSSDNANSNVAAPSPPPRVKKPAWNKPSNGTTVDVGPVMGASTWPALSESTTTNRASPKSSSTSTDSSSKPLLISQGPVTASSSSSQKQVTNNANPNSAPNQAFPTRQKSMKRGGSGPANGGFTRPQSTSPSPSPFPSASASVEMPRKNFSGKTGSMVPVSFPRDPSHKINGWESGTRGGGFMSQPHIGNDHHHHQQQRNSSFKRGNGGSHPHGDGPYQQNQNFVGRREHDRDWNPHRSFNGRDVQQQQRVVNARNFIRTPPPGTGPFITPQPVRPYGNAIGFPEVYFVAGEPVGGFVYAHPPAMPIPSPEPNLRSRLATQIDYYFSSENLCKDIYLRQNMDEQGWVPISLIAGFNRVKKLTNNIQFITDTVRTSTIIEIQGDRIRKRNDWMNWPLPPPPNKFAPVPGSQSTCVSDYDMLANRIQSVGLEEGKATNHNYTNPADPLTKSGLSRSSSGELNSQSQTSNGEGTSQVTVQAGSDRSISTRS